MTEQQDLLFELGCEELPPKNLLTLSNALLNNMLKGLDEAGLSYQDSKAYATPRRLAVLIKGLNSAQADKVVEKRGPAVKAAFAEDGSPSRAALGFAKSCGAEFDALERMKTDKGEWLIFKQAVKGKASTELVPEIINKSIRTLPIAKKMRWGNSTTEFVRPVHWAVLLYGETVIDAEILGLKTGNQSRGHRFHAPEAITIQTPDLYVESLRTQGQVIADFSERKELIRVAANEAAAKVGGLAHIEEDLLEEIASLNEQPVPVTGNFDERFLNLPKEVLITTMQSNQKYFPVVNDKGDLLAHFITFSNVKSTRPESIQHGNERVILPRLADAEFFWNQDRKQPLSARVEKLQTIVFQQKLGTLFDKTTRLQTLAFYIANEINADAELAQSAAHLAKTDLITDMVGEFASLQGIMGRYYALADGEDAEVAQAIEEQYFPKQSGTATPSSVTGQVLSLADKMDTLTGIFSAGLIPTGDKDPYALRRASLGILRIIIENKLSLNIIDLISYALQQYSHDFDRGKTKALVTDFVFERLKGYCLDHGFKADEFEAVISIKPAQPLDFMARLQAVQHFRALPEAESLAAANKRISNILKKSETAPAESVGNLIESQERQLQGLAEKSAADIKPLLKQGDYEAALSR
ncbi:MAG: glycine--tRNA ligase subunit beta, partial [Methylococcaceae bacterium]|nr:glycine--tRNA ligase subunit beta [Methylococcaceae bacterium]